MISRENFTYSALHGLRDAVDGDRLQQLADPTASRTAETRKVDVPASGGRVTVVVAGLERQAAAGDGSGTSSARNSALHPPPGC